MALQLLGLQRCPACATSEIVWKCSVCDNAVRSEDLGDDHDGISMPGLRCAACGEARELSSFVIPESLTVLGPRIPQCRKAPEGEVFG